VSHAQQIVSGSQLVPMKEVHHEHHSLKVYAHCRQIVARSNPRAEHGGRDLCGEELANVLGWP
jgi:hypothetical protein